MGTEVRALHVAGIPALAIYRGEITEAARRGTILYYHGFGGSKEEARAPLAALAAAGFLGLALDNAGHGERRLLDFTERFNEGVPDDAWAAHFFGLVRATAEEVPVVIDHLLARGLAAPEKIGVAGWSMGGFVAYAAIAADPRLRAACPIVAAPEWRLPWAESPHRHAERFFPAALLSQTAGDDRTVPPDAARRFHETLVPYYADAPERLRYIEYPDVGHAVPQVVTDVIWSRTADWFRCFLTD